ncbi:hypothetical protein ILYODFUR_036134 [Ilyodon furcidens]|uniref:Uncharacterized protein n=1 Tax=Ilyodon furcidens TaxID=33524 RepID=A0ABV0ULV7_9TELE
MVQSPGSSLIFSSAQPTASLQGVGQRWAWRRWILCLLNHLCVDVVIYFGSLSNDDPFSVFYQWPPDFYLVLQRVRYAKHSENSGGSSPNLPGGAGWGQCFFGYGPYALKHHETSDYHINAYLMWKELASLFCPG